MKIGFDARMITHPGIGRYTQCLLAELIKQARGDEFVLFGDPKELIFYEGERNARIAPWNPPIYSVQEQLFTPYDREKLDLLHVPHFNIPVFTNTKLVVTIHDLIYLLFPESVSNPLATYYARYMIGRSLEKAEEIIAVSENTRHDLVRIFDPKKAEHKVAVIPEAAGKAFKPIEDENVLEGVREKYGLSDKIILYVGSVKPHKNVATLLSVYETLKEWGIKHELVIVGRWDKKEDRLKEEMRAEGVKYIGDVPLEDLVPLYNAADVLVHLSLYEGFGLTILEAMQCGTPVVVSESSSITEVAGPAALTVPPYEVRQIADVVYNSIINKEIRDKMISAGFRRAEEFSWERTAKETLAVYSNIR